MRCGLEFSPCFCIRRSAATRRRVEKTALFRGLNWTGFRCPSQRPLRTRRLALPCLRRRIEAFAGWRGAFLGATQRRCSHAACWPRCNGIMNLLKTLLAAFICVSSIAALAADDSSRSIPSKQEEKKIEEVAGAEVGRSAKDGITVSGERAFVTRNGKTEALVDRLTLDDGTEVMPDGTIRTKDGRAIALKAEQVLGFNGTITAAPIKDPPPQPRKPSSLAAPAALGGVTNSSSSTPQTGGTSAAGTGTSNGSIGNPGVLAGGFGGAFTSVPSVVAAGTAIDGLSLPAATVTTDPSTGLPVFSAVNPATGQLVTSTVDPRTNQTVSTTTFNGQQVTTTTNPQTGQPVNIVTDAQGRTTATTVDPSTGQSIPAQFNTRTGQVSTAQSATGQTLPTTSNSLQQNPAPTTQQGQNQQIQQGSTTQQTQSPSQIDQQRQIRARSGNVQNQQQPQGGSTNRGTQSNTNPNQGSGTNTGNTGNSGGTSGGVSGGSGRTSRRH